MRYDTAEHQRLAAYRHQASNWKNWGPYLSERAWGTVREDYSAGGSAWDYFPHDHARSRAYRWNEDGLAGISDRGQYICLALALWNGRDPILKERLYGLTGPQGNHGEDVKEYYFYLDSTPTHSYMQMLYKYAQRPFPYAQLERENRRRGFHEFEYELLDTGVFADDRYFDVFVTYAKAAENDVLTTVTAVNRGPDSAELHLLPTLWLRNTWRWGYPSGPMVDVLRQPLLALQDGQVHIDHPTTGPYRLAADGAPTWLFTENETNSERLFGVANVGPYVKDAFHRAVVNGEAGAVNPALRGTKVAAHYRQTVAPGGSWTVRLRLSAAEGAPTAPFAGFDEVVGLRSAESDAFYAAVQPAHLSDDDRRIQRQAFAGMLWTKQLYYYDVRQWLRGDPAGPPPPAARRTGRNHDWEHLNNFDIISMPDKWEYPWYAAWDLAFHCIPLAHIDPDFAKRQLVLMTREWYMHPNGQLPAYEWAFGDVNPPVHAWAALRVYEIDADHTGRPDRPFLEGLYHKMLLNFTWWVNRKDVDGRNIFQGGFLGLDNISIFDRSASLPVGGRLDQADGTAWMAFYCLIMLRIALVLAEEEPIYEDTATKFFEHFLAIAHAMTDLGGQGHGLWDERDGFFYDALHLPDGRVMPLRVRSLVGLMPLLGVAVLPPGVLERMPDFARRVRWFLEHRSDISNSIATLDAPGQGERLLASVVTRDRLTRLLRYMLDEDEFLSPHGIRSLSRHHERQPYALTYRGETFRIAYEPAESQSGLFGGNSNWRGPVWFPINFLLIEALQTHHLYYGDEFTVEYPTGSGTRLTLRAVADELTTRLINLFRRNAAGERPVYGGTRVFQDDPHWRDWVLFYEYYHGDNGAGLGASHQTGWTGLVADLLLRQER